MNKKIKEHLVYGKQPKRDKGLGRLISLDFRDKNFLVAKKSTNLREKYYQIREVLNQGNTNQCVAYAWESFLATDPIRNAYYKKPSDLYRECQKNDDIPGENYEGTSVRAGAKVLKSKSYLGSYSWAFDAETAQNFILTTSPMVFGTDWYDTLSSPDKNGFVMLTTDSVLEGGHAYLVTGVNLDIKCPDGSRGAFRFINSWGKDWGDNGYAWLPINDADFLIKCPGGEACTAFENKFKKVGSGN